MTSISYILPLSKDISKHKKSTTGELLPKFGKQHLESIRNTLMFTDNVRLFTCLSLLLWQQHHVQSYAERQTISAPQQEKEVNRGAKFGSVAGTSWAVTGLQGVVRTLIAQLFPHPAWSCTTVTPQLYLKGAATCCVWPCCDLVSWGIEK